MVQNEKIYVYRIVYPGFPFSMILDIPSRSLFCLCFVHVSNYFIIFTFSMYILIVKAPTVKSDAVLKVLVMIPLIGGSFTGFA